MSLTQVTEVGIAALVAGATTGVAVVQLELTTFATILVPIGASSVVGYFAAQVTVRSELAELHTEMRLIREELHRYYRLKQGN